MNEHVPASWPGTYPLLITRACASPHSWTEIRVKRPPPDVTKLSLHCFNLDILQVVVDDQLAKYQQLVFGSRQEIPEGALVDDAERGCNIAEVADVAYSSYLDALRRENEDAELVIDLASTRKGPAAQDGDGDAIMADASAVDDASRPPNSLPSQPPLRAEPAAGGNAGETNSAISGDAAAPATQAPSTAGSQPAPSTAPDTMTIGIRFAKRHKDASVTFYSGFAVADGQARRARGCFPCVDLPSCMCTFDVQVTTEPSNTAVCSGWMSEQTVEEAAGGRGSAAPVGGNAPHGVVSRTFK